MENFLRDGKILCEGKMPSDKTVFPLDFPKEEEKRTDKAPQAENPSSDEEDSDEEYSLSSSSSSSSLSSSVYSTSDEEDMEID